MHRIMSSARFVLLVLGLFCNNKSGATAHIASIKDHVVARRPTSSWRRLVFTVSLRRGFHGLLISCHPALNHR